MSCSFGIPERMFSYRQYYTFGTSNVILEILEIGSIT